MQPSSSHSQQQHMLPPPGPARVQQQPPLSRPAHVQQQYMPPLSGLAHAQQQYMPPLSGPAYVQQQHMLPLSGPSHRPQDFFQHELQQQLPFNDVLREHMPTLNICGNPQQQLPSGDVLNNTQNWTFQQHQRQGSSTVRDTDSITFHPPSPPLHPPMSVITSASPLSTTTPAVSVTSSRSSSKRKQSAYGDVASGANSEKRRKSGGAPGAVAVVGLRQSLNIFNNSFTQSMAANANATSRKYKMEAAAIKTPDRAVMLVQQQETNLTNDQTIILINLFQTSTPHSTTYLNI